MRRFSFALLIGAAAFATAASTGSILAHAEDMHSMTMSSHPPMSAPAATTSVQIRDFAFQPASIVVSPGATVTWTNADDEPHTVTANDRIYHSAVLDTDQRYTHTYTAPGEYHYFCSLHPHMTGVVIVRAPNRAQGS